MKLKKGLVDDIHCVTDCISAVDAYVSIHALKYSCSRRVAAVTECIAAVTVENCIW